jgi:hypothetical protein
VIASPAASAVGGGVAAEFKRDVDMILRGCLIALISAGFGLLAPVAASAQEPQLQGRHNDWRVYTLGDGADRVCYALSRPTDMRPGNVAHGDIFFLVSSWASGATREQPSFAAAYDLRPSSPPVARVGSTRAPMYVSQQEGFVENASDERRLVEAMRRGASMRVEATSARGTAVVYTFSLSGVTASLRQVRQLCG